MTLKNILLLVGLIAVGCGEGSVSIPDSGQDAGQDAGGDDAGLDAGEDAGQDAGGDDGGLSGDDAGGGDDGGQVADDGGVDAADESPVYGAMFYVSLSGLDDNPGTIDEPFKTLERARTAIRDLKNSSGLPEDGVVVWVREGVYERESTFELSAEDSGEAGKPVVYRAYPGEEVRLVGAKKLESSWFSTVDDTSPVWDRVDPLARGSLVQVDLSAHGISDYGTLRERGFGGNAIAALELFFNAEPMELARWPDKD